LLRVHPQGHLSPVLSLVAASIMLALPVYFFLCATLRSLRNARLARVPDEARVDGASGEGVYEGKVARAEDAAVAMRVEIDQTGTESETSGSYSWRWTETDRRVHFAPFYLVRNDGARLRVEPTEGAYLVDDLDRKIRVKDDFRTKVAELVEGEHVWIAGSLSDGPDPESREGRGYRGAGMGKILRAPRSRPLLISSEPLGARYAQRSRFHARFAAALLLVLTACAAMVAPFADRTLGTSYRGAVTHVVELHDEDGHPSGYDTDVEGAFPKVTSTLKTENAEGAVADVRVGRFSSQIGARATLHFFYPPLAFFLVAIAAIAYRIRAGQTLPWYRRKLVESGSGKLADNR
jgi:hypothetical protein